MPVMMRVTTAVTIDAPPHTVWEDIARLDTHVEWMADAERIEFVGEQRSGPGTVMRVLTRIGPLRTTDVMEFVAWEPPHRMAIRHEGLVTGHGEFVLAPIGDETTEMSWSEELRFPWWFGGRVGEYLARPVFVWIWRRNLTRLAARFA